MEFEWSILLIVIFFGFLAAFIDSVAGGGGLIAIPALLSIGMPPVQAIATNKLASSFGSLTSSIRFLRGRYVNLKVVTRLFPVSVAVSMLGALLAVNMPGDILKPLVLFMLIVVLVYTLIKKDWGQIEKDNVLTIRKILYLIIFSVIIAFYDGFMGGGTGSFLMFLMLFVGFDFLKSAGNAKVLNFGSNLGSLILFIIVGEVNYTYGLVMGVSMIFGSWIGAQMAISKGVGYVKVLFVIVTSVLIIKNIYDFIAG